MDLRDLKYAITGFYWRIFVKSVLMRENMGQWKPVFSQFYAVLVKLKN